MSNPKHPSAFIYARTTEDKNVVYDSVDASQQNVDTHNIGKFLGVVNTDGTFTPWVPKICPACNHRY